MMIMFLAQGMAFMILASVESHLAVFIASAWVGLNFGGNFALFPSATADYFGTRNLGMNYGWIFTAYGVAGILGPVVGGVLFDATGQYLLAFVFAGLLCFLAAACAVVVENKVPSPAEAAGLLLVAHVDAEREGVREARGHILGPGLVQVGHQHPGSLGREGPRDLGAEARRRARHDHPLVPESRHLAFSRAQSLMVTLLSCV